MSYDETLNYLYAIPMFTQVGIKAYNPSLDKTIELDNFLGNQHLNYKTIHVAGTNGKGSSSHLIASVLMEAGYKVGLYTSPHLFDFRERIRVDGKMISKDAVINYITKVKEKIEYLKPSFFEVTTLMAFDYFASQNVDIAVIETGLGGRLDSTNIISPIASLITNIGKDHMAILGDTLQKIAEQKAGIIKPYTPVVFSEHGIQSTPTLISKAKECNAPFLIAENIYRIVKNEITDGYNKITYESLLEGHIFDLKCDLQGDYQCKNIAGILTIFDTLRSNSILNIDRRHIEQGIENCAANTSLMGRWQVLSNKPLVVCDTGHNKHGIDCVVRQLSRSKYENLYMVIGFVEDKELDPILEILPQNGYYYFTSPPSARALKAEILQEKAAKYGLKGECVGDVNQSFKKAEKAANEGDMIFIGGSTFVVGALKTPLK